MKIEVLKITMSPKKDNSFQMWSQFSWKIINKNTKFPKILEEKSNLVNLENFCWNHLLTNDVIMYCTNLVWNFSIRVVNLAKGFRQKVRIFQIHSCSLISTNNSQQEKDDYFLLILRFKHVLKDCRLWCVSFQIRSQNAQVAQQFSG